MTILWALHVQGPDDVYAAPSWAAAAEAAAWFEHQFTQRRILKEPDLPAVAFAAIPWTHSAESHAKELVRWPEVYPGLPAAQPAQHDPMPIQAPIGWPDRPEPLPWAVIEPHRAQASANHDQTLEELRRRGGLSACEAVAILEDRPWRQMCQATAFERLAELVAAATKARRA